MMTNFLQWTMTWAEDRALLRSNPSADPRAKTGDRAASARPRLSSCSLRDWHQSDKPSRPDAAKSPTGYHPQVANDERSKFQFTVNQDTYREVNESVISFVIGILALQRKIAQSDVRKPF